jgi:hypothetical protein
MRFIIIPTPPALKQPAGAGAEKTTVADMTSGHILQRWAILGAALVRRLSEPSVLR